MIIIQKTGQLPHGGKFAYKTNFMAQKAFLPNLLLIIMATDYLCQLILDAH